MGWKMIKLLSEVSAADISIAGIKGAYLGELKKAGFSVPNGFIILADNHAVSESQIMQYVKELGLSVVSVRSSPAPDSSHRIQYVGQLETHTWVKDWELMHAISDCRDSLNSKSVKSYMLRNGITEKPPLAILIHEMVNADAAGVISTASRKDENHMVINACLGAGPGVTSGKVMPDCYIIDRKSGSIVEECINKQKIMVTEAGWSQVLPERGAERKLTIAQIGEICKLALEIEDYFKKPQDIEFCFDNGMLWILQTKPMIR